MNARESSDKASKNQFRQFVKERVALKRKVVEKKVPTQQQLEKKALAYQLFLQHKAHLKRLSGDRRGEELCSCCRPLQTSGVFTLH